MAAFEGQGIADRGVAEGPQIIELEFKEAAAPGLVLVQKVNVVTEDRRVPR